LYVDQPNPQLDHGASFYCFDKEHILLESFLVYLITVTGLRTTTQDSVSESGDPNLPSRRQGLFYAPNKKMNLPPNFPFHHFSLFTNLHDGESISKEQTTVDCS
jgi:hypothetical protein